MKLKYYLRGLGIGIIVTAVILTITSQGNKKTLTDEEIMKRAQELGMVMKEDISEDTEPEIPNDADEVGDAPVDMAKDTSADTGQEVLENKQEDTNGDNPADTDPEDMNGDNPADTDPEDMGGDNPTDTEAEDTDGDNPVGTLAGNTPKESEMVMVEVVKGEFSDRICQKLVKAGLIADAEDFNRYLMDKKVDSLIAVGVHQIPKGATYEEIAKILSQKPEKQQ